MNARSFKIIYITTYLYKPKLLIQIHIWVKFQHQISYIKGSLRKKEHISYISSYSPATDYNRRTTLKKRHVGPRVAFDALIEVAFVEVAITLVYRVYDE